MGRRGNGEGAIYKSPDGRWRAVVDLGWRNGKRDRKYVSGRTRSEAAAKLRELQRQIDGGVVPEGRLTVEVWLRHWLTVIRGNVVDSTISQYTTTVETHLIPALGRVPLDRLLPEHVDRLLAEKADKGLSRSYVSRMRTILSAALKEAEKRGKVSRNVALLSTMPRTQAPTPRRSLTSEEVSQLLDAAKGHRLEALIVVGLVTGLRPGELTGLRWSDVTLRDYPPTLTVSGSLKRVVSPEQKGYRLELGAVKRSANGRRTIELPALALEALKAHKARQATEELSAGELWEKTGLVFCAEFGTPLDPSNLRRRFGEVAKKAALPRDVSFVYMFRHSVVSHLLAGGESIEDVADLVGDDPRTLYKHYRHQIRPVSRAALRMEAALGSQAVAASGC